MPVDSERKASSVTKITPLLPLIQGCLSEDRSLPPKQRHTDKRIDGRLRDKHGYPYTYSTNFRHNSRTHGSMIDKKKVLLFIESTTSYGRAVLRGISSYVNERAHWMTTMHERGIHDAPPNWLKNWKGDGLISRTANPSAQAVLKRLSCCSVELQGDGAERPTEVTEDEVIICRLAFEHFRDQGLKNYAFYAFGNSWWIRFRVHTYCNILKKEGIDCCLLEEKTRRRVNLHPIWDERYEKPLIEWLHGLPKPTGLMTLYDYQSALVIEACHKAGIAVPEEISVLGVDNDEHLCNLVMPSISSVDSNAARIGYEAARLLDLKMSGKPLPPRPILVNPCGVIQRRSTDIIAVEDPDVVAALVFIRKNIFSGITVADIVREVAVSQSTLQRRFKKFYRRTLEQEMLRLKIARAKELLRNTNHSVSVIAELSGFSGQDYFVKAFKHVLGTTPLRFRKAEQNPSDLPAGIKLTKFIQTLTK